MTKRNQDFETLVKKVFVKEYSFKFNESISLDGVRYDLWDPLKGAFVEIIEHANKNKRSIILDRVLKTIRNLNKAETEINYYFLIFNDKITQSDKEYYIKNLIFTKFPIEILDRDDINRLSNNNENSSIKGNSNIKFSPVANIKDKTAPATPTITSIESLDFRTRDYSNEFLKFLLEGSENKQNIKDLLTNLTKEQLVAFILNRVEGKNYNQITKILGISQKAGQQRIFDVLEKLRVKIDDSEILEASRKVRGEKIYGAVDKLRVEIGDNNYFLAGHVWDGEDQMERFVKEGIWENGHTNNDVNAVNSVKKGDVVFLKSTEIGKGKSYLVIKAIGVVLKNLEDGHNLKLNWEIIHNYIKIQGLGKYRRTFARVMPKDVPSIIEKVLAEIPNYVQIINDLHSNLSDLSSEENTETNKSVKNTTSTTIAGLISDTDSGADYLDISKDITAFARVITAKSFKPPLAIALLGKWGSGKSFFMRKLKERVQNLSRSNNSQNAYCSGIAHVHFNAWSYMDSNLWAGIITKIFEGLQKYITNDTLASANKKEIEKALTKKLNIAHDEITDLEYQKESIDNKIETLESQKDETEATLQKKIDEIKSKSIKTVLNKLDESFNISEKVKVALASNNSFDKSTERFGEIVPKEYWQNPTELYKKTKSKYTYLKTFFKGANWKNSLAWFCLILIFVISMKTIVFFLTKLIGVTDFTFPTKIWYYISIGGAFIYRNYKTFKQLQPLISSFWKIKEDYELQKKDAIFKVNQAEKALKFEIENYKTEIQTINEQINQANHTKTEIEYRLENTLTTEALFNFIEKRSVSDDYKKHLGIVSVIRKDFEILSELFSGHNDELNNSDESKKFQKQFSKPLERIILYIDDLDRCSEERVVQVLEAVNLLMAYPLFIVVVGVDPRWVKNALIKKHHLQFDIDENKLSSSEKIEVSNYLEKIFQVPFHLKSASDESVKHMLKTLAESQPELLLENDEELLYNEDYEISGITDENEIEIEFENSDLEDLKPKNKKLIENIESLKFSKKEVDLLQDMSELIGTSPRAIKRFINIYRIIKAHEDFNYFNESEDGELLAVMFLIALPIGKFRKLANSFNLFINNGEGQEKLSEYLGSEYRNKFLVNSEIDPFEGNNSMAHLYKILLDKSSILLDQHKSTFLKHNDFIKRFTFNNI